MKSKFMLTLTLIVTLNAIRIDHKLDRIYSYAGITHYASQQPQHEDNVRSRVKHLSDLNENSAKHSQAFNQMNAIKTHKNHKQSRPKINFTYSNKPPILTAAFLALADLTEQ
jgi:hypothetical protein